MPLTCFFFNDTATTEIYTLSLHDALPISVRGAHSGDDAGGRPRTAQLAGRSTRPAYLARPTVPCKKPPACRSDRRSEEHTSELQSRLQLACRLLLEKKKRIHLNTISVRHS